MTNQRYEQNFIKKMSIQSTLKMYVCVCMYLRIIWLTFLYFFEESLLLLFCHKNPFI